MQYTLRANMNKSLVNEPGRANQQIDMLSQPAASRQPMAASMIQPVMHEDTPPGSHRVFSPPNMKDDMYQQPPKPPLQSSGPQSGIFNSVFGGTVVNKQQN